jgi:hypothetical protein
MSFGVAGNHRRQSFAQNKRQGKTFFLTKVLASDNRMANSKNVSCSVEMETDAKTSLSLQTRGLLKIILTAVLH